MDTIMRLVKVVKSGHLVFLLAFFIALALNGCASHSPQVKFAEGVNFTAINTFYVEPPLNSLNETIESHLITAITSIMQRKGLRPETKDKADIKVAFLPSTAHKEGGSSLNIGVGTGLLGRVGGISLGSIFKVPVGEQVSQYQNLHIDIIQNGSFIYSAAGSAELKAADRITAQEALTKLVNELLEPYPAK
ncbi:DUF4136 domain-containing protein [Alteromonas lipolytica]|uniref:DUF4136 domain-containing protein n=1 Tax=Alteromonas lipolytica TaxID=1856405 RepID=A0A1E8FCK4_9ALTE|nr:DUF4136 domain-containing protein [Alteromonas lipolytica]OFI33650.1 hypothetical protein BFC17_18900 [Alteromonas lipolytica]GGF69654.1 hypothetical protein GCM10011338_22250 [Alteromonas lipolytica]